MSVVSGYRPGLAIDDSDRIIVAYQADVDAVYVKRWSGSAWEELAGSASGQGFGSGPSSDIQKATPAKKKLRCWSAWTRSLSNVAASYSAGMCQA